ncbi:MAG: sigma-54-dependent Fis family transcriptional regulator [Nitrospirae bacterium]|nr:MAG: sigma-54-dependent Fis family transcriptional regulator [Nitrospirota bacterium]
MATILLIEDNERMAQVLARHMEMEGHAVVMVVDGEKGIEEFRRQKVDLVLTDLKLPGKSGLEVLQAVKEENPMIPVLVMTAHGTIETAVKAVKDGAFDFLQKPVDPDHLLIIIGKALDARQLVTENLILKEELAQTKYAKMVGQSRALLDAQEKAKKVAVGPTTVLLLGESGTGKELFARMIHDCSPRKNGAFVAINCAAIPRELLESELFGHERGSFTGAAGRKLGKFELADKGTVFLDEIGDMDMGLQAKLLRVLEGERFMRVGGTSPVKADVRVVAATNKDLLAAVATHAFREDLYYRLNVFPLVIPPLRDRREDIPLLVEHFLAMYSRELKREGLTVSSEAKEIMMHHPWTGNIRELQNCIERAVILCDGREILPEHIGLRAPAGPAEEGLPAVGSLQEASSAASRAVEAKMIEKVLRETGGNKTKAAEILQVSYKTLLNKIKDYALDKD